jgi:putative CocE/NonD family hydrolase
MHPAPRLRLFNPHSPLFLLPLLASLAVAPPASGDTCTYTMQKDVPAAMRDSVILRSNDTIEWAAGFPKSNGKVGMYGFSYPGAAQLLPASVQPPHLVTIIPAMTSSDYHDGWTYEGGALDQSFAEDWPMTTIANSHVRRYPDGAAIDAVMNQAVGDEFTKWYWFLPLKDFPPLFPNDPRVAPYFFDWLKHPDNDAYWQRWSLRTRYGQIKVPALHFDGWYDIFIDGALENFNGLRHGAGSQFARDDQQLVVGPWLHIPWLQKVGQIDFGPQAANPIDTLQLRWSPLSQALSAQRRQGELGARRRLAQRRQAGGRRR